jgi:MscS family membrane protein
MKRAALALVVVSVRATRTDTTGPLSPRLLRAGVLLVCLLLTSHLPARGADDPLGRATPRGTVAGYLGAVREGDYQRAAEYLDLRRIPPGKRPSLGPARARELGVVVDRTVTPTPEAFSASPEGNTDDGLAPYLERLATLETRTGPVEILLQRIPAADGSQAWEVSAASVAQIPQLYEEFGAGVLDDVLPPLLREVRVLDIALWQWMGLLVLVAVAYGFSWIAPLAIRRVLRPLVRRLRPAVDDKILESMGGPVRLASGLLLFSLGLLALGLSVPVRAFFADLEKALAIVIAAWVVVRMIDVFAGLAREQLAVRGRTPALAMVPVGRKVAKVVVAAFTLLAVLQNVGINVTGVLAGLGIGGLAVALAAQKTLENLFGGLTLIFDQPVRVGDFCRFGDRVGTVEEVGLRSTRVRTLDRTVVSVPNAEFAALQLENFAERDRIWLSARLGLRYETTPDQLRYVLVQIREMLYAHPKVHPDPARIRFVGFGAYSLDLEIFAYVLTMDYGEFLAVREDIYLRIMDIVAASGAGFAFPSQTTYLASDGGLDHAKSRAAEGHVREWRARGELCLPEFPSERIAAVRGTLRYPPDGAAADRLT